MRPLLGGELVATGTFPLPSARVLGAAVGLRVGSVTREAPLYPTQWAAGIHWIASDGFKPLHRKCWKDPSPSPMWERAPSGTGVKTPHGSQNHRITE